LERREPRGVTAYTGSTAYLAKARARLESAGYGWVDTRASFAGAARLKRFQLTKFGLWETFFVFREFSQIDQNSLQRFVREANEWAYENRSTTLPRGLFAGVGVFAIALAESVDERTLQSVRENKPDKHWAAVEMPAVYDARAARLVYFEKTPVWGAAYYRGLRKQLTDVLSPE
jgi:hypothetical protein